MSGLRLFFGIPLAVVITVGLFLGMNSLISQDTDVPAPVDYVDIVVNANNPPPEGPEYPKSGEQLIPDDIVPPVIDTNSRERSPGPGPIFTGPIEGPGPDGDPDDLKFPSILSPIIRIEPQYPPRCLDRGKEGSAMVEFDITAEGAVINPRIVSTSDRCFNHRFLLEAVSRWRYSPPGKLVRGQRTTLTFKIAE